MQLPTTPGSSTGGIVGVSNNLVRAVFIQAVDGVGRQAYALVVPFTSTLHASYLPSVGRVVFIIFGVVIAVVFEMEEFGHDIYPAVDVLLLSSPVGKTAEADPVINADRTVCNQTSRAAYTPPDSD